MPGFHAAVVRWPVGARTDAHPPLPLVVALHSAADRPEWMCRHLQELTAPGADLPHGAVLLCPAGVPRRDVPPHDPRWTFGTASATAAEVAAALAALRAKHGAKLSDAAPILIGFSLGASRAAALALAAPARWQRLLLWEGGAGLLRGSAWRRALRAGVVVRIGCAAAGCLRAAGAACRGHAPAACGVFHLPSMGHSVEPPWARLARPQLVAIWR